MDALVSVGELKARPGLGDIGDVEAAALLADASALVRLAANGALDDVDHTSATRPAAVVPVVVAMVRRGRHNPNGVAQETLGDYSYSAGGGGQGAASLYMTRREVRIVRRAAGVLGAGTAQLEGYLPVRDDRAAGVGEFEDQWLESL